MSELTPAQARHKHKATFDRFFLAYPRKTHINEASNAWSKLMEQGADPVRIVKAAKAFAGKFGTDLQYCPGPHRWLENGRYEDADLFEDEQAAIKVWFQQQSRTANVKAVQDRLHITMPKSYPPDDITTPEGIRFWYAQQAKAWIREVYEERYEKQCPAQPTMSEQSKQSSEESFTHQQSLPI